MTDAAATFAFIDIAGFTALTEAHGDEHAVALVDELCAAVEAELPAVRGEHVKTIGAAEAMPEHGAPAVRVGLHHGPAVERDGDYFGATVNLAARVSALAAGGEVLVTGQTAALVPDLGGVIYESRGRHELKNVREPVELFAALPVGHTQDRLPVDPVCRMVVDPDRAPGRLVHEGTAFFFCSLACAGEFAQQPERYVQPATGRP
jgi:adenylate cyclase